MFNLFAKTPTPETGLTLQVPESVDPPLDFWQMASDRNDRRQQGRDPLGYIRTVTARFTAPADDGEATDVVLNLAAPGMVTPQSPTAFERVQAGETVEATWRWAAPIRRGRDVPKLHLVADARFTQGRGPRTLSDEADVEIVQPPAPSRDTYLSDLPMTYVVNGFGPVEFDTNNGDQWPGDGGPITLDGKVHDKGIGMHAHGAIGYNLGGNGLLLTAVIGIDDSRDQNGSVIFRVVGDGKTLYDSGVMTGSTPAKSIRVRLGGVDKLELVADATPDGQPNDWADWGDAFLTTKNGPRPAAEIIAHAGGAYEFPENTLVAVKHAWSVNADAVEIDVHLTLDGKLIVIHDANTERTAGTKMVVAETPLAELQKLDVGRWKGEAFAGEAPPTLDEVLATVPRGKENGTKRLVVEVKVGPEAVPALLAAFDRSGLPAGLTPVISFNRDTCREVKKQRPELPVYLLSGFKKDEQDRWTPTADELIAEARRSNLDGLDLAFEGPVDKAFIDKANQAGLDVYMWTIDNADVAKKFVDAGAKGITTNRPAYCAEALVDAASE